jgi:hypothetical protein
MILMKELIHYHGSLLQKSFIGAGRIAFSGRARHPSLSPAARNSLFQRRVKGPPLKTYFQRQVMAPTAPGNAFTGAAHNMTRP